MKNCVLAALAVLLAGCDSSTSSGSGSGGRNKDVHYAITAAGPECIRPDRTSSYSSDRAVAYTCIWFCGNYKDARRAYVSLDFWNFGDGWELRTEYIDSGICR